MNQKLLKSISENISCKIFNKEINNFSDSPFPHLYIENFFEEEFANTLLSSFPSLESEEWEVTEDSEIEVKMRSKWASEFDIPEHIVDAIDAILFRFVCSDVAVKHTAAISTVTPHVKMVA